MLINSTTNTNTDNNTTITDNDNSFFVVELNKRNAVKRKS